jgi:hypothetical protein
MKNTWIHWECQFVVYKRDSRLSLQNLQILYSFWREVGSKGFEGRTGELLIQKNNRGKNRMRYSQ